MKDLDFPLEITAEDIVEVASGEKSKFNFLPEIYWTAVKNADGPSFVRLEHVWDGVLLEARPLPEDYLWHVEAWLAPKPLPTDLGTLRLAWSVLVQEEEPYFTCTVGYDAVIKYDVYSEKATMEGCFYRMLEDLSSLAQEFHDKEELSTYVEGVKLNQYGGMIPYQAFGEWLGYPFYFRYRGGHASLSIGEPDKDPVATPLWRAGVDYGHGLDGALEFSEFCRLFAYLSTKLETAAYPYMFLILEAPEMDEEEKKWGRSPGETVTLYGVTMEEALNRTRDGYWGEYRFADKPENTDDRVFPEHKPVFPVKPGVVEAAETMIANHPDRGDGREYHG